MSVALTHLAFDAICATLLLAYLPIRTRYTLAITVVSGLWAMTPDLWWVFPIYENAFNSLGHSALGNIFWLHPLFD